MSQHSLTLETWGNHQLKAVFGHGSFPDPTRVANNAPQIPYSQLVRGTPFLPPLRLRRLSLSPRISMPSDSRPGTFSASKPLPLQPLPIMPHPRPKSTAS